MSRLIIIDAVNRFLAIKKSTEHFNPVVSYRRPEMRFIEYPSRKSLEQAMEILNRRVGAFDDEEKYTDPKIEWDDEPPTDKWARSEGKELEAMQLWGLYGVEYETEEVIIDPMEAQVQWHAGSRNPRYYIDRHSVVLLDAAQKERFWDRNREIDEWVATRAQRDVFAQPTTNGWRFVFLTEYDHHSFRQWISEPKKTKITLPLRGMRQNNILNWVKQHVRGDWYAVESSDIITLTLMFRDPVDAATCKMRWSDPNQGVEREEEEV